MAFLDVDKPKTLGQWVIWLAAMGVVFSTPFGATAVVGSLREELIKRKALKEKEINSRNLSQALYYAQKKKLIRIKNEGGKITMTLTERGRKRSLEYEWEKMKISKPENWDGRWRMLMFDIPEKKRAVRNALRLKLTSLGFIQFQKSVWIYPYACEDEINFIGENLGIGEYLHLLTAKIENDGEIKSRFAIS